MIHHLESWHPAGMEYLSRREGLMALAAATAAKREVEAPAEAQAARLLFSRIENERLG